MSLFIQKLQSCRVCFDTKCSETISLKENQELLDLFKFCVDIVIDLNLTPHVLCKTCAKEIEVYAKFKQKCQLSEEFWKSCENSYYVHKEDLCNSDQDKTSKDECDSNKHYIFSNPLADNKLNSDRIVILSTSEADTVNSNNVIKSSCRQKNNTSNTIVSIKSYQCVRCNKVFAKYKCLKKHKTSCSLNKYIKTKEVIEKNEEVEDKENNYECGLCDLSFQDDKIRLKEHLNEHWSQNELKCKLCNFCGRDFADMIIHRYSHCPNTSAACHVCDKRTIAMKSLEFHFRSVHLHKIGGWCSFCNKVFTTCKTWKRHERLHTDNRLFICDLCGRKFLYRYQIQAHLVDHSDVRHFVCETCGKAFKRLSALKGHLENVHEPSSPVVCEHCNRTYKNKEKLELHLKKLSEYKPFQCAVCSKRYVLESELNSHMFWHSDERPHVCEICGSKYKAKGQLKVHMRNHTGEKPFKCETCGKGFGTTSQVKRHKSVHTGVRAHKCGYCRRSFHGLKGLLEHSLQHKECSNNTLESVESMSKPESQTTSRQ